MFRPCFVGLLHVRYYHCTLPCVVIALEKNQAKSTAIHTMIARMRVLVLRHVEKQ